MKRLLVFSMVTMLVLGTVTAAFATSPTGGSGTNSNAGKMANLANKLNLSADQQQKLLAIRQEFEKETLSLRQDMKKKEQELRNLWKASPLDQAALEASTKQIVGLRVQLMTQARAMRDKAKAVFTPDQLKQLESLKSQSASGKDAQGMGGHRGFRHGGAMFGGF